MSYALRLANLQSMREAYRDNPDPQVQKILNDYTVDFCLMRVEEIFHAGFLAEIAIRNARLGRSMHSDEASSE